MITLRLPDARLAGDLAIPDGATGVVLFAPGGGAGHRSRDRAVADGLNAAGLGTLLIDLLTEEEDQRDRAAASGIGLLTGRLTGAIDRLTEGLEAAPHTAGLPIGLLGSGTGSAAALAAAAARHRIGAVVSRGGRPDLAGPAVARVRAAVLLIAGGLDAEAVALNERVHRELDTSELHVVPGAGQAFDEPGALQEVTMQAADWFVRRM